tara:strand:+ start:367 stop:501 length:135 start_codon:yes stop_codon:yes gene_type:complete
LIKYNVRNKELINGIFVFMALSSYDIEITEFDDFDPSYLNITDF